MERRVALESNFPNYQKNLVEMTLYRNGAFGAFGVWKKWRSINNSQSAQSLSAFWKEVPKVRNIKSHIKQ